PRVGVLIGWPAEGTMEATGAARTGAGTTCARTPTAATTPWSAPHGPASSATWATTAASRRCAPARAPRPTRRASASSAGTSRPPLAPRGGGPPIPSPNLWAATWIQFMVPAWVSHGPPATTRPDHVPLAPDDPLRLRYGIEALPPPATPADPTRRPEDGGR